MSTLYDLFKVKENATQEELKESYNKILEKANSLPQTDKVVEQVRRVKIAYGILSNPEKRKKYDLDLAAKRADQLIENIQFKQEEPKQEEKQMPINNIEEPKLDEERIKKAIDEQLNNVANTMQETQKNSDNEKKEEKSRARQLKKEERKRKRQYKKDQQFKREMQIQAYGEYLQNQGYKVKYPWTWLRVKRLIITIISIIIVAVIAWHIPFVRNTLTDLYNENFIVQILTDMVVSLFKSIIEAIKSIFE